MFVVIAKYVGQISVFSKTVVFLKLLKRENFVSVWQSLDSAGRPKVRRSLGQDVHRGRIFPGYQIWKRTSYGQQCSGKRKRLAYLRHSVCTQLMLALVFQLKTDTGIVFTIASKECVKTIFQLHSAVRA